MFELIKVILFVAVFESIKCDWTLVPVDPTQYGSQYPACQTALQYPVNLNTSAAIYYQSLAPISFVNFDKPLYFNFTNNGYTSNYFNFLSLLIACFNVNFSKFSPIKLVIWVLVRLSLEVTSALMFTSFSSFIFTGELMFTLAVNI